MKTLVHWGLTLCAIAVFGHGCKPPQPAGKPGASSNSKARAGDTVALKGQTPVKVDGSGSFSFAEVEGLELFIVYYAPWTDAGKNIQGLISGLEKAGRWVLPVAVDNRAPQQRASDAPAPKGRLPAVWADESLAAIAGELRALPTIVQLDASGKTAGKWLGHVNSDRILADLANPK